MKTKKNSENINNKMRVSFDLDEVLFVFPETHKIERPPGFPFNKIFKERLRLGTPRLINRLQEAYIKCLFFLYGVRFDGIVNGTRHLKEVQRDNKETLPQKVPSRYRISLHVDDETVICTLGRQYGFNAYQLDAQDDDWEEKIVQRAEQIKKREFPS